MSVVRILCVAAIMLVATDSSAAINAWSQTGPDGGKVSAVHYIAGSPGTIVAAARGRVYRSTDNGVTWTIVLTVEFQSANFVFAGHPQNPNRIALAGALNGVYVSQDAGLTFSLAGSFPPGTGSNVISLTYAPDGSSLYAGVSSNKVTRSTDNGLTWSLPTGDLPSATSIFDVAVSPTNSNHVFVAAFGNFPNCGVFRSVDGGVTFTQRAPAQYRSISIDPNNANAVVAAGFAGIYSSADGGTTFPYVFGGDHFSVVRFDPITAGRVFAVSEGGKIYRSINSGQNWTLLANLRTIDALSLSFDTTRTGRLVFSSSEGVMISEDDGVNWQRRHSQIYAGTFGRFRAHQASNSLFMGGSGPLGVYKLAPNGEWQSLGLSSLLAVPPPTPLPSTIYAKDVRLLAVAGADASLLHAARDFGILKSNDAGATWSSPSSSYGVAVIDLAVDPTDPSILYAATDTQSIVRSLNGGVTWAPRSTGITETRMSLVKVDPRNSSTLYAGGSSANTFYKSVDAGATWTRLTLPVSFISVFGISIDPSDSNTIYVSTFGSSAILRSRDGGATWSSRLSSFGFLGDVVIDPALPNVLYVTNSAADNPLRRSVDGGDTFEIMTAPPSAPNFLAIDPRNANNLFVSASDRGLWQYEIANDLQILASGTLVATNTAQAVSLQVSNRGTLASLQTKALIGVPPGSTAISATADKGGVCTVSGLQVECIGSMLRSSDVMTISLSLNPGSTAGGTLSATASARETDPVATNNSASIAVQAAPPTPASGGGGGGGGGGSAEWWVLLGAALLALRNAIRYDYRLRRCFRTGAF